MRHFLLSATLVAGLGACASPPQFNLTESINMVTDSSFSVGCENYPAGYEACYAVRVQIVKNGVNEWFKHFDAATRPQLIIVNSEEELPPNMVNPVIYLRVKRGGCWKDSKNHPACYRWEYDESPEIVFDDWTHIEPLMVAHEFGHALGRDHHDTPVEVSSVMSYERPSYVVPVDIDLVCDMHAECPPHENTWCQGGFYDPCRCPSSSFDDGQAQLLAGTLTCDGDNKMVGAQSLRDLD